MVQPNFELVEKVSFVEILIHKNYPILAVAYKESSYIDLEMAREVTEKVYPYLIKHSIKLLISDNSANYISSTPEARTYLSNNKSLQLIKAHAVIVKHLPVKILVNSFLKNNKPVVPSKSFKTYNEAINWLQSYELANSSKVPSV